MGARHRLDGRHHRPASIDDSAILGWDDPVPSFSDDSPSLDSSCPTHDLECEVRRRLLNEPGLSFSSLVVRRLADGVCIQGVLETADAPNLASLAKQVQGVDRVIDQVVIHQNENAVDTACC